MSDEQSVDELFCLVIFVNCKKKQNGSLSNFNSMKSEPIKTEHDYENALKRLKAIFDSKAGTKDGDELEIVGMLIERYENEHFPIGLPDPVEAIKFRMEQLDFLKRFSKDY